MTLVIRWLDGTELLSNVRDNTREILAPLLGITINLMKLAAGDLPLVAVTFLFHTHMLDFFFFFYLITSCSIIHTLFSSAVLDDFDISSASIWIYDEPLEY